ncbi:HAD family hydrolase [Fictibacillus nanhaiensis]|uniref:HAD family hydrolase n=1 Tax=Fictibacillus nanhaiensis TaxID=742169 RepID=UPI002E1CDD61|nr:HAD family hydrolase [Fictibacillus nanhaiensis]
MQTKKTAFFFDLDNTLFDYEASFKKASLFAFRSIYSSGEQNTKIEEKWFIHYKYFCDSYWQAYENHRITREEYQSKRLLSSLRAAGLRNFSHLELQKFQQLFEVNIHLFVEPYSWIRDIFQVLTRYEIVYGIITNGSTIVQRNKIKQLQLHIPDKRIYISSEIKVAKPSPEIFHLVKENTTACDFYYVGDSYSLDMVPAILAKWTAIWWNPLRLSVMNDNNPHHNCYSSNELIETIKRCIE